MNRKYLSACIIFLSVFFAGSALAEDEYPALDCASDADTCSATVSVGGKFSVSLVGNASTGYSWALDYDTDYLSLDSTESQSLCASSTDLIMVGCSQEEIYKFTALKEGSADLTMTYSRSWESVEPAEKKIYSISIAPSDTVCAQVITPAKNSSTGECVEYPTPCDVPSGWEKVDSCSSSSAGQQTLGPITIDKPLSEMDTNELLQTLVRLIVALLGSVKL